MTTPNKPDNDKLNERPTRPEGTENRPVFERPALRKLGKLPLVTTAFGGSFSP